VVPPDGFVHREKRGKLFAQKMKKTKKIKKKPDAVTITAPWSPVEIRVVPGAVMRIDRDDPDGEMENSVSMMAGTTLQETRNSTYYTVPFNETRATRFGGPRYELAGPPIVVCTPVSGYIEDELWYPY